MAKRSSPPPLKPPDQEELQRLTVKIPKSLHTRIRVDALKRGTTATEIVTEVLLRVWPESG